MFPFYYLGYLRNYQKILVTIQAKPEITQKNLAQSSGTILDDIKYHIKNMDRLGTIKHKGSTKSGKWGIKIDHKDNTTNIKKYICTKIIKY